MKKIIGIAAACALTLALTACGVQVIGVQLPEDVSLTEGEAVDIQASLVTDREGLSAQEMGKLVEKAAPVFEVGDESIAVYEGSTLTALRAGQTTLTVTTADGSFSDELTITVEPAVTGVEAPEELVLTMGSEEQAALDARVLPRQAPAALVYESSDEGIAAVDEQGRLTAVAPGECIVTVTVQGTGFSAQTKILVKPLEAASDKEPAGPSGNMGNGSDGFDDNVIIDGSNNGGTGGTNTNPDRNDGGNDGWMPELPPLQPGGQIGDQVVEGGGQVPGAGM